MKPIIPEHPDPSSVELIDAYLRDELDKEARIAVEARRKSDPVFDNLFVALIQLSAAAQATHLEEKLAMLRVHSASSPLVVTTGLPRRRLISRIAAAAIVLLLIAAGLQVLLCRDVNPLYTTHFTIDVLPGKGELSDHPPHDWKAYDHYLRGNYHKAAQEFDRLRIEFPNSEYLLYAAVSHLGAGNTRQAELLLRDAAQQLPGNMEEIIFYQTLLLVRQGDIPAAKTLLDSHPEMVEHSVHLGSLYKDLSR